MKTKLGRQEMQMLAYLQMRKRRTVRTGELTGPLQLTRDQERELFRRMARGGLIARVRPGLYLAPAQLPLGGSWSPDETLALNTLLEDRRGRYQICGPNAFNRYGFDEQVPNPRLCLQQPDLGRADHRSDRSDADQGGGRTAWRHGGGADAGGPDRRRMARGCGRWWTRCMTGHGSTACHGPMSGFEANWPRTGSMRRNLVTVTLALRRQGNDPADRCAVGGTTREGGAASKAGASVETLDESDPVESHETETGNGQPPLGGCAE